MGKGKEERQDNEGGGTSRRRRALTLTNVRLIVQGVDRQVGNCGRGRKKDRRNDGHGRHHRGIRRRLVCVPTYSGKSRSDTPRVLISFVVCFTVYILILTPNKFKNFRRFKDMQCFDMS